MNYEESKRILAVLQVAYPHSFTKLTPDDVRATVNLWQRQFAAESYQEVDAAIQMLIATRTVGYAPTIGEIKEKLRLLHSADEPDEAAAWALVSKACSNGIYGYRTEYAKLPPNVQRAVGQPEQLREWAMMDANTVQSVVASNFMRSYRARAAHEKELSMIPSKVRNMISKASETLKLEGNSYE